MLQLHEKRTNGKVKVIERPYSFQNSVFKNFERTFVENYHILTATCDVNDSK